MFKKLLECSPRKKIAMTFDGVPIEAEEGDTVAAALLQAGFEATRSSVVSGSPRGPYCMMGVCFECLVTIDQRIDQQACMILAREGMTITRQLRASELALS